MLAILRFKAARAALDQMLEAARQAGYDAGYEDGATVRVRVLPLPDRGLTGTRASQQLG